MRKTGVYRVLLVRHRVHEEGTPVTTSHSDSRARMC